MSYRKKHIKPKIKKLKTKKSFLKKPIFWLVLLSLIIVSVIFYFVLFFPNFQVTKIEVYGNNKVKNQDIENTAWINVNKKILTTGILNISTKSIFLVNKENLIKNILDKFPEIESIQVDKKTFNSLELKVKERELFAVFCSNYIETEKCFFIDENGVVFEQLKDYPESITILRNSLDSKEVFVGENVISKNIIDVISRVGSNLKNNFQIDVKEVFLSNPLIFKTSEQWQIYFDPSSDINLQITKMNVLLKDEIPLSIRKNLQYIYLQYKDRAYYK